MSRLQNPVIIVNEKNKILSDKGKWGNDPFKIMLFKDKGFAKEFSTDLKDIRFVNCKMKMNRIKSNTDSKENHFYVVNAEDKRDDRIQTFYQSDRKLLKNALKNNFQIENIKGAIDMYRSIRDEKHLGDYGMDGQEEWKKTRGILLTPKDPNVIIKIPEKCIHSKEEVKSMLSSKNRQRGGSLNSGDDDWANKMWEKIWRLEGYSEENIKNFSLPRMERIYNEIKSHKCYDTKVEMKTPEIDSEGRYNFLFHVCKGCKKEWGLELFMFEDEIKFEKTPKEISDFLCPPEWWDKIKKNFDQLKQQWREQRRKNKYGN